MRAICRRWLCQPFSAPYQRACIFFYVYLYVHVVQSSIKKYIKDVISTEMLFSLNIAIFHRRQRLQSTPRCDLKCTNNFSRDKKKYFKIKKLSRKISCFVLRYPQPYSHRSRVILQNSRGVIAPLPFTFFKCSCKFMYKRPLLTFFNVSSMGVPKLAQN